MNSVKMKKKKKMTNDNNTVLNTVVKKTLPIKKIREDKIIPKKNTLTPSPAPLLNFVPKIESD